MYAFDIIAGDTQLCFSFWFKLSLGVDSTDEVEEESVIGKGRKGRKPIQGLLLSYHFGQLQLSPAEDLGNMVEYTSEFSPLQGETAGVFKYQPSSGNGRGLLLGEEGAINSLSTSACRCWLLMIRCVYTETSDMNNISYRKSLYLYMLKATICSM